MTATRTITIEVPASWYAGEDRYGDSEAWAHMPSRSLGDEPVRDAEIAALVVAALPRMQWGILDEHHPAVDILPSEAQACVEAVACRQLGDTNVVVHRLDEADPWRDDHGVEYPAERHPVGRHYSMLATRRRASAALDWARSIAAAGGEGGWVLDALRREARAHGYDLADLEG